MWVGHPVSAPVSSLHAPLCLVVQLLTRLPSLIGIDHCLGLGPESRSRNTVAC